MKHKKPLPATPVQAPSEPVKQTSELRQKLTFAGFIVFVALFAIASMRIEQMKQNAKICPQHAESLELQIKSLQAERADLLGGRTQLIRTIDSLRKQAAIRPRTSNMNVNAAGDINGSVIQTEKINTLIVK